ncbi:MAG: D-3-phosphoglycerate dehydrogenase [Saprospiraceae bacterium]|jgi:D-3-phosphoglycerate dehydrogenase
MIRILANDGLHDDGKLLLEEAGYEVDIMKVTQKDLPNVLPDYDVIIVRSATQIRQDLIDKCPNLKVIVRGGLGYDNIDAEYAQSKDIKVMTTPIASSVSVAELVFGHLLCVARNLHKSNRQMRENGNVHFKKLKREYSEGFELKGRKIGIIGFGRVGQAVAQIAIGFGMEIMPVDNAFESVKLDLDIFNIPNMSLTIDLPTYSFEEVLEHADIISIHVPYIGKPLISNNEIAMMKDGVVLINASRGGTVNETALLHGLNTGKIRAAGIDVFENEPTPNMELLNHPSVSTSPHIGASTVEGQRRVGLALADKIIEFFGA